MEDDERSDCGDGGVNAQCARRARCIGPDSNLKSSRREHDAVLDAASDWRVEATATLKPRFGQPEHWHYRRRPRPLASCRISAYQLSHSAGCRLAWCL
jgi:hypothetical protein